MTVTYFPLSHFLLPLCWASASVRKIKGVWRELPTDSHHHFHLPPSTDSAFLAVCRWFSCSHTETSPAPVLSSSNFLSRVSLIFQTLLDHSQQHTNVLLFSYHKTNLKSPPFLTDFFVDRCLFLCSPLQQNIATRVFCTRSLWLSPPFNSITGYSRETALVTIPKSFAFPVLSAWNVFPQISARPHYWDSVRPTLTFGICPWVP